MNYYDVLKAIRQNPAQPNVGTRLSVHQEDGMVIYGHGSLRYHEDLFSLIRPDPKLPIPLWSARPTAHFPIEGLSSRDGNSFKILNSAEL